jgi:hypothetical protein
MVNCIEHFRGENIRFNRFRPIALQRLLRVDNAAALANAARELRLAKSTEGW